MRTPASLLCFCASLLLTTCLQAAPSKPPAPAPAPSQKAPPKAAPAAKPEVKEEPKIPGYVLNRPNGGFLSLTLDGGNFQLKFYDSNKKQAKADAVRAMAKWRPKQKTSNVICMLLPAGDGMSLDGNKFVQPPYVFIVYLSLFNASDTVTESHVINIQGDDKEALLDTQSE